jgi:hypothetical protein
LSSTAEHRLHRGWLVIAAVAIAAAPLCWRWINSAFDVQADAVLKSSRPPVLPALALQFLSNQELFGRSEQLPPRVGARPAVAADQVGSALDLKRVFDDYIESADPRQRRIAVRAFEACVPAFLPTSGQSPSPEPLIAALPFAHRAEREAAYRSLFARCSRLLADGRAALIATSEALHSDPQSPAPGRSAQEAALMGRADRVEPLISEALDRADPAAVASLAGVAARIVSLRQPDGANAATLQHAREIDAAVPLVACDLGLDCSKESLWALQLCATEGLCEGDVAARLLARAPGTVDPDAVQKERLRLLGLVRSGRTLGTADLLPP